MIDFLPFPNQPTTSPLGGQFVTARARIGEDDTVLVKGDLHLKDGSLLAFTWNRLDPSFGDPHIAPQDDRTWFDSADRYAASWLKSRGRWALESRFGWSEVDQARLDKLFLDRDPTNSNETIPYTRRLPIINTPEWATLSDSEVWTTDSTTFNLDQKIGYVRSGHSIKFGGGYQYKSGNRTNPECPSFDFASFDDLLANRPNRVTYTFGEPNHNGRVFQFGFFVQDDRKVRRNFTLNLGVRYDFISNFTANRIEDDGPRSTGRGVDLTTLNLEPPSDWTKFDFGRPLPASKPFKHDAMNIGPRFGFNWDLSGEGKMVVRGGYGLMYAPNTIAVLRDVVQELFIPRRFRFLSKGETEQFGVRVGVLNGEGREIVRNRALSGGFNPIPFAIYNPFATRSLPWLEKVFEESPENREAWELWADIMTASGEYDEAIARLERQVRQSPRIPYPQFLVAQLYVNRGLLAKAEKGFIEAARVSSADSDLNRRAVYSLGYLYVSLGRLEEGERLLRKILSQDSSHVPALTALSDLLVKTGRSEDAGRLLSRAREIAPSDAEVLLVLAQYHLKLTQWGEAAAILNGLLKKQPDYLQAHFFLGQALKRLGRVNEATEHFRMFDELKKKARAEAANRRRGLAVEGIK